MSDIIEILTSADRIWIPNSDIGKDVFSVTLVVLSGEAKMVLSLGRPYQGLDERLWGLVEDKDSNAIFESSDFFELKVSGVAISMRKLSDNIVLTEDLRSIEELSFRSDSEELRIFGSTDDFDVPCLRCVLRGLR